MYIVEAGGGRGGIGVVRAWEQVMGLRSKEGWSSRGVLALGGGPAARFSARTIILRAGVKPTNTLRPTPANKVKLEGPPSNADEPISAVHGTSA